MSHHPSQFCSAREPRPAAAPRAPRRGMALMVVMIVVAVATVLGFAMLSASALQSAATDNLRQAVCAEYLAGSGAQIAMYYLQYPSASPVALTNGYYPGQTGVQIDPSISGTVDITVSKSSSVYTITSVGKATVTNGTPITRTLTATTSIVSQFQQTTAATFANTGRLPAYGSTIVGDVWSNGTLSNYAKLTGNVKCRSPFSNYGTFLGNKTYLAASDSVVVPSAVSSIKDYTQPYTYNGVSGTPQKLAVTSLSNTVLPTATDALTNPAGIYWTDQNLSLNGNVTVNGTIIVTNGTLQVQGPANSIVANPGFPALVVSSDIVVSSTLALLPGITCTGLVWTGTGLKTGQLSSTVAITGGFLAAGTTPIDTSYKGMVTLTFDATKVVLPDFSTVGAVPTGIRVITWSMN